MTTWYELKTVANRSIAVFVVMLVLVATASAYTIVMRGGRRIEIPSTFVVTRNTLTYEVSPGFQVTLQMAAIDVAATERANNELPGALLKRAESLPQTETVEQATTSGARRTITNRELEANKLRRLDSELAYDRRAKELGIPSLAESRRKAEFEAQLLAEEREANRISETDSERYWRSRARDLRTEIAALDAEIGYVRARLDEVPSPNWNGSSFTTTNSMMPLISLGNSGYGIVGGRRYLRGNRTNQSNVFSSPTAVQPNGRAGNRGNRRGRNFFNPRHSVFFRPYYDLGGLGIGVLPNQPVYNFSGGDDEYSYERNALITRFNELAATRAGLNARWRALEDEARREGAPPGWLRE